MSGLNLLVEMGRTGGASIAKVLKGSGTGISHVAIGRGPVGTFTPNPRVGNNMEITFAGGVVTVHNDVPVFNFGPNGDIGKFYFIETTDSSRDLIMSFGGATTGAASLVQNKFNHLFMSHSGTSGTFGIADLVNVPTDNATEPTGVAEVISYLGFIEVVLFVRSVHNPTRMFDEIARVVPVIDFSSDAIIGSIEGLSIDPNHIVTYPTVTLTSRGQFTPVGPETVREIALLGDGGNDIIAFSKVADTPIAVGQNLLVRIQTTF